VRSSRVTRISRLFCIASCLAVAWGCDSLKDAPHDGAPGVGTSGGVGDGGGGVGPADPSGGPGGPGNSSDGGPGGGADGGGDSGEIVDPAIVGAGPLGALPTGYCCASDDDCRNRHCENVGGTKMCLDFCLGDDTCMGVTTGFHCAVSTEGYGFCQPTAGTTPACIPKATYRHGLKPLGACCQPLGDGRQGSECLSGVCDRNGAQNPYLCTTDCGKAMCPNTFTCGHADDFGLRYECLPVAFDYTCSP
jgi:hypothetical protein